MSTALASAYTLHRTSLMWSLMRIVRDQQTAEDITQEAFIRARKAIETGTVEHIEAFLHRTAWNLALDHQRRNRMRSHVEKRDVADVELTNVASDAPSAEAVVIQRERLRLFDEAFRKLPKRAQTVWRLSRVEKWTHPQIAAHLGISPGTVFNDLKMAIAHLEDAIERIDRS